MKITHLNSACQLVESNGVKILIDPWLVDGEFYGSWYTFPSLTDFDFNTLNDVDFIYISHIHPDHLSKLTLEKLDKNIPVLIHNFKDKFVKINIESMGFKTRELESNVDTFLGPNININIIPAGYCNPELCSKIFGCGKMEVNYGSTIIDSLCVISDGEHTLLNVNDCPYPIAYKAMDKVLEKYEKIDFLLVGYGGASPYPQCFSNYTNEEKIKMGENHKNYYFNSGLDYINKVKPTHFMPHAGTYILGGVNAKLEKYKALNDIYETNKKFSELNSNNSKGILLNTNEYFDLTTHDQSSPYIHHTTEERDDYLEEIRKIKYDFEQDDIPDIDFLKDLCIKSNKRFNEKREQLGLYSDMVIYLYLSEDLMAQISFKGEKIKFVKVKEIKDKQYISFKVNPKLLVKILKGPRYAHWNNAGIGSHVEYHRHPDVYERGVYFCMNYFHS